MKKCSLVFVLFAILLSGSVAFAAPVQYLSAAQIRVQPRYGPER